jgi:hypothetical protein
MVLPFAIGAVVLGVSMDFQTPLFGQVWPVDAVNVLTSFLANRYGRARDNTATTGARENTLVTSCAGRVDPHNIT